MLNFKILKKPNKIRYLQYVITPKGISERTNLTIAFMKRKLKEYDELKKELIEKKKMWTIIKIDKKKFNLLKSDFEKNW